METASAPLEETRLLRPPCWTWVLALSLLTNVTCLVLVVLLTQRLDATRNDVTQLQQQGAPLVSGQNSSVVKLNNLTAVVQGLLADTRTLGANLSALTRTVQNQVPVTADTLPGLPQWQDRLQRNLTLNVTAASVSGLDIWLRTRVQERIPSGTIIYVYGRDPRFNSDTGSTTALKQAYVYLMTNILLGPVTLCVESNLSSRTIFDYYPQSNLVTLDGSNLTWTIDSPLRIHTDLFIRDLVLSAKKSATMIAGFNGAHIDLRNVNFTNYDSILYLRGRSTVWMYSSFWERTDGVPYTEFPFAVFGGSFLWFNNPYPSSNRNCTINVQEGGTVIYDGAICSFRCSTGGAVYSTYQVAPLCRA